MNNVLHELLNCTLVKCYPADPPKKRRASLEHQRAAARAGARRWAAKGLGNKPQ